MYKTHLFVCLSFCFKNKKICKGQPCDQTVISHNKIDVIYTTTTTDIPYTTTAKISSTTQINENKCISGWSKWIKKSYNNSEVGVQPLPSIDELKNLELNVNIS